MKKKKGKRVKRVDGEIPLPEAMIQHIQSFLSGKEAVRTTILSKSWYNAWLTRPVLDFDPRDFHLFRAESKHMFKEFVTKTMQRYQNLSLKIDSFRLCRYGSYIWGHDLIASSHNLIVGAMKMGATTVQLEDCSFTLPQEVLGSQTLLKLSLMRCKVDGNYVIRCSSLKSLTLDLVNGDDFCKDLISRCVSSMEELSLSNCYGLRMNQFEFHKLKHLFLQCVDVGNIFSRNFSSTFPCLKDLSILQCYGCTNIQIASTSLETVCFKTDKVPEGAKYDVPNIRKFTYSCFGLPSHLYINGASKEWEFDISIASNCFHKISWFINLKKLLQKFSLSRISLCLRLYSTSWRRNYDCEHDVDVEVVPKPLLVEKLTINAEFPFFSALVVVRSLGAFRPKFITPPHGLYYAWILVKVKSVDVFRKTLIQQMFILNWEDMFGQFGLKKVNVEMYDKFDREWQPPKLKKAKADCDAKACKKIADGSASSSKEGKGFSFSLCQ